MGDMDAKPGLARRTDEADAPCETTDVADLHKRIRALSRQVQVMQTKLEHMDSLFVSYSNLSMTITEWMRRDQGVLLKLNDLRHQMNKAASILLASDVDAFEGSLLRLMEILVRGMDADRMSLFRNHREADGRLHCRPFYRWPLVDATYDSDAVRDSLYDEIMPEYEKALSSGRPVNALTGDLSPPVRNYLSRYGIRAILFIPLRLRDEFTGFVLFVSRHREQVFTEQEVSIARSGSLLIGNAILGNEITQRLIAAQREAFAASQAKSRFLASVSHDIRTPMNAIIGLSELMPTDNMDRTQREYLEDIKRMSRTLLDIINDVLDFSKIESGKMELVPVHYSLRALYGDVCSIAKSMAVGKPLLVGGGLDANLPDTLLGDEARVRQIIMNLVHNAIKYTQRGYVDIRFQRAGKDGCDHLSIAVADTGIGIRQKDFLRMFEAFEQLDRDRNKAIPGTGLGLSITKRLVELMQGDISLASEYGKGSTFTVLLPLVEGDPGKTEQARPRKHCRVSSRARILVVDDNALNLTVALGFLEKHGIRADTATSGEAAIAKVGVNRYALVFMDHLMPGMDGIEAVRHIRALGGEHGTMPIIALSANAVLNVRNEFFQAGMNDFLAKPINGDDLNAALVRWLPPEMVLDEEQTQDDDATPAYPDQLLPLMAIRDLDVRTGVRRSSGNPAVYLNILCQFCRDLDRDVADISAFMANAAWQDYSVRLHALKNTFANFGNQRLSALALRLEQASIAGDTHACLTRTQEFCEEMEQFRARLLEARLMALEDAGKKRVAPQELLRSLEQLQRACRERDARAATGITRTLQDVACGLPQADALLMEICDWVDLVEYGDALRACVTLAGMLSGHIAELSGVSIGEDRGKR